MKKLVIDLSPASFVTVYTPRTKIQRTPNSILSELLIEEEPTGAYSKQMHTLRKRFNDMYYRFIEKLTLLGKVGHLSRSQQEDLHSLFEELIEMRTLLEKEPISTT